MSTEAEKRAVANYQKNRDAIMLSRLHGINISLYKLRVR